MPESFDALKFPMEQLERMTSKQIAAKVLELFFGGVGGDESGFNAHLGHGDGDEVEGAAVDGGSRNHVVAAGGNVENGIEVCRLTRGGQHCGSSALKLADPGGNGVAGGVLKSGVEVARCLKVKELAHILTGAVFKGSALNDRYLSGLSVTGSISALNAFCFYFIVRHNNSPFYVIDYSYTIQ